MLNRTAIHIRSERLKPLKPLLKCWIDLNVRYTRDLKWKDFPWWYNERTFVGLLAAAAWIVGGHSLEEYSTRKHRRRSQYPGRGDLYFWLNSVGYIAEAKHEWVVASRRSTMSSKRLLKSLRVARKSVVDAETPSGRKLGLLFVVPMVPWRERGNILKLADQLIKKLRDDISYDAAAWVFPNQVKLLPDRSHVFPGVALLVLEENIS